MGRFLTILATLALLALGSGAQAQPEPASAQADPIGNLIDMVTADPETSTNPDPAPAPLETPQGDADWRMRATLYHSGAGGVGTRDASGCTTVAMRTVAVDRRVVPRKSVLYIAETVGLPMPDGSRHDGYWYASDTGGAIRGNKIDLYTGGNRASMRPVMRLSTATVSVTRVGTFEGCPRAEGPGAMQVAMAR